MNEENAQDGKIGFLDVFRVHVLIYLYVYNLIFFSVIIALVSSKVP